ncbi:MAG TPA: 2-amino-3,7-dideoxy-D-threo-hept-6-ulosonate synthase [bacterium]|nr:2-amino-3,7-dideoxy-D-threo-hept-6-ulosonate synthase [bacterium]
MIGKKVRLERLMDREKMRTVIVPMDHGVSVGPIAGLIDMGASVNSVADGGANAVLGHLGLPLHGHRGYGKDIGLILHLSASTSLNPDPNDKVLVSNVERSIKMGADGVSIHCNLGAKHESKMLEALGQVSLACMDWGMPLLAMMYCRGEKIKNEYDVKFVKHAARVASELGADIVKVNYTGSPDTFREVVEGSSIPVVIAGGEKMNTVAQVLTMVKGSIDAGGAGVSIGRNVFQAADTTRITAAISAIVHRNASVKDALDIVKSGSKKKK